MLPGSIAAVKLGQPVRLSNLLTEANSGSPDTTSTWMPGSLLSQYSFLNGGNVRPNLIRQRHNVTGGRRHCAAQAAAGIRRQGRPAIGGSAVPS
jgi:hypothetical protein